MLVSSAQVTLGRVAVTILVVMIVQAGAAQQTRPTFRSGVETVSIYATARSSDGRLVADLTKDDFEIKDNGQLRDITNFSREIVPITVTLMLDMSGSRETRVEWTRAAARAFVDELLPADRAHIGTFGAEIAISPRLTGDHSYLHRVIDEEIWPGGPTPLWASIDAAMSSLDGETGRRVILLLTDGYDSYARLDPEMIAALERINAINASQSIAASRSVAPAPGGSMPLRTQFDDVMSRATRGQFMVYAVTYGAALSSSGVVIGDPINAITKTLTRETGGGFREFGTKQDAVGAMVEVVQELHHQYLLGFEPISADGKLHHVDVRIKRRGVSATATQTYLAAKK
jgi:VWFA-related protein